MTETKRSTDPREPEDAIVRFMACFDAHDLEGMIPFFASAGVWKRPDGDVAGVDGLRAFMERRGKGVFARHVISNMRTTFSHDTATVESYVVVYRHDFSGTPQLPAPLRGPDVVGRFHDVLVHEDGAWKLLVHESIVELKRE